MRRLGTPIPVRTKKIPVAKEKEITLYNSYKFLIFFCIQFDQSNHPIFLFKFWSHFFFFLCGSNKVPWITDDIQTYILICTSFFLSFAVRCVWIISDIVTLYRLTRPFINSCNIIWCLLLQSFTLYAAVYDTSRSQFISMVLVLILYFSNFYNYHLSYYKPLVCAFFN